MHVLWIVYCIQQGAGTRWSLRDLLALIHSTSHNRLPESNLEKGTFHTSALGLLTRGGRPHYFENKQTMPSVQQRSLPPQVVNLFGRISERLSFGAKLEPLLLSLPLPIPHSRHWSLFILAQHDADTSYLVEPTMTPLGTCSLSFLGKLMMGASCFTRVSEWWLLWPLRANKTFLSLGGVTQVWKWLITLLISLSNQLCDELEIHLMDAVPWLANVWTGGHWISVHSQRREGAQVSEYNWWSDFIYTHLETELRAELSHLFPRQILKRQGTWDTVSPIALARLQSRQFTTRYLRVNYTHYKAFCPL